LVLDFLGLFGDEEEEEEEEEEAAMLAVEARGVCFWRWGSA